MARKSCQSNRERNGFSLLELLVSVTILMVIASAVLAVMSSYQKTYQTTQLRADMYLSLRGVSELMAQEIGQAGLFSIPSSPTLNTAVTLPCLPGPQCTVTVSSLLGLFKGEKLLVDQGAAQELVTIVNIIPSSQQIVAVFNNNHPNLAPLNVQGVFFGGIFPGPPAGSNKLEMYGDLEGDGSLVFVRYICNLPPSPTPSLTRSITPVNSTITTVPPGPPPGGDVDTLLNTLIPNPPPQSRPCFVTTTTTVNGYTIVNNVAVTLSLRSAVADPVTHGFLTMTKSFMDLTPRNLLGAIELASIPAANLLQPKPPNLPLL